VLLDNKVAVVTGASKGIGREIALVFAREGAQVVLAARNVEALESLAREITQNHGKEPLVAPLNVSDEQSVEQLTDRVLDKYERIDILVNNAGVTRDGLLVRMPEEDWDEVLDTNLKGAFFAMKHVGKAMMRQRRGKIVNVASVVGLIGNPGQANYSASKAGIIALTKSAAKELASRNVLVNAIAPGFIDTDMTRSLPDAVKNEMLRVIPMKRFGTVQDVAKVALYLASDQSDYITGQVITVDGGMVM